MTRNKLSEQRRQEADVAAGFNKGMEGLYERIAKLGDLEEAIGLLR